MGESDGETTDHSSRLEALLASSRALRVMVALLQALVFVIARGLLLLLTPVLVRQTSGREGACFMILGGHETEWIVTGTSYQAQCCTRLSSTH